MVCAKEVNGDIRFVPHHPAPVRDLRNVEQLTGAKLEYPSVVQRCRCCARHNQTDVCHRAALRANGRPNVLGPPPPGLVSCSANRESAYASTSNFPFSMKRVSSGDSNRRRVTSIGDGLMMHLDC
jgi:hypothetical protein